jgi:ribosomal protein S6E (S10)
MLFRGFAQMTIQPINYDSTSTLESKSTPGVKFTINEFSHGKRARLRVKLSASLDKIRDLTEQMDTIMEDLPGDDEVTAITGAPASEEGGTTVILELPDAVAAPVMDKERKKEKDRLEREALGKVQRIGEKIDGITALEIDPEYLRIGLVEVTGITDKNGAPFNADTLYESGPEVLCEEIVAAIKRAAGLTPQERANLGLPITSGAVADGQTSNTIAPDASNESSTSGPEETAIAISQS